MLDRSNVILQGVVGSTAYGLAHADSDRDQLGIYVAPIEYVLGLNGSGDLVEGPQNVADSQVTHDPDLSLHEVGKYVRLALAANPTVLELLFLPKYEICSSAAHEHLVSNRTAFLSGPKIKARYGGYVRAQAERLLRRNDEGKTGFSSDVGKRTEKHGRHLTRLLIQGTQLLREGTMDVDVSRHRNKIFSAGEWASHEPQAFYDRAIRDLAVFDSLPTSLPDAPDRDRVERALIHLRVAEDQGRLEALLNLLDLAHL